MAIFKSPSPLQPVGFGAPDLNYALTPQLANQLQPDMQPDTTGLQILGKAGDALQQTLQQQAQSNKQEEQASIQLAQQQAAQQAAITQTTLASIQTRASSSSSDSWGKLAGTALGMVEGIAKQEAARRAADLKAELENNQLKATTSLENLQVEWIEGGLIGKRGTLAYRKAVGDILSQHRLEPDTISALTTKYYAPALDKAKQVDSNQVKAAEDVIIAEKSIVYETARMELNTAFASMKSSDPTENSAAFERFNEVIKKVEDNPNLGKLAKITVTGNLLTLAVNSSGEGTALRAKIKDLQKYNNEISVFYNEYAPQVNNGTITDDQFYDWYNAIRASNGLPPENSPSADRAMESQNKRNKLRQDVLAVNDAETKRAIAALPANKIVTKALAAQMYLDPAVQALIKQEITDGKASPNTRAAYDLSVEAVKFRDVEYVDYTSKLAAITTRITSLSAAGTRELLDMQAATKGGGQAALSIENLRNQLAGMGVGAGVGGTPERPAYTEEQRAIIQNARQQAINAVGEERNLLMSNWNNRQTQMASQGIYIKTAQTQQFIKQAQGEIDSFNKSVRDINNQPQLSPTATGKQPNFSSGMSRKPAVAPLMKRSYGGKTITVPFDISVADLSRGQRFHAERPGNRTHDGLDFGLPIGTPLKSLVSGVVVANRVSAEGYGKSVEIRGDDGFTYFFAHLSKQLLPVGGTVAAGETLGLSGNTGTSKDEHLHLEVWASKPGDAVPTSAEMIDPLLHLSTREFGDKVPMVRSANGRPPAAELPPGAYSLGGGDYLLNGRIIRGAQPNVESSTRTSTPASSAVDVFALPTAGLDPTGNIPVRKGLELVGYVNTWKNASDKTMGVATYRNRAGGLLTLTLPAPKDKNAKVPDSFGFDGRGFIAPNPTPQQVESAAPSPSRVDPNNSNRVLVQRTGVKDASGLESLKVTLYNKQGKNVGEYVTNSGDPTMQGAFGAGNTTVAGSRAPMEYGSYSIGAAEAAYDIPGMRSNFIPIEPQFGTKRSLLGIHFDGDRAINPGSAGCLVFANKGDFDKFHSSLKANGLSMLEFRRQDAANLKPAPTQMSFNSFQTTGKAQTIAGVSMPPEIAAFVEMFRVGEGTVGEKGFTTMFTGTQFSSFKDHPRKLHSSNGLTSDAAGMGQFISTTWDGVRKQLNLPDFSPTSQVKGIIQLIKNRGAYDDLMAGRMDSALSKLSHEWASLPTGINATKGRYGQPNKTGAQAQEIYKRVLAGMKNGGGPAPNTPIKQLPPGAVRTGPNNYFDPATKSIKVGSVYNSSSPFQSSYAPMSAVAYAPADNRDDFGYAQLKENPKIQEGVHGLAAKHGIPAQWVADAAMLKGTSGIDGNELEEMDALLARQKSAPKTTQQFLAAVLPEMDAKEANLAFGIHGGRRYDSIFAALLRAQAPTHERRFKNCAMCAQLSRQEVFTPHKAEPIA